SRSAAGRTRLVGHGALEPLHGVDHLLGVDTLRQFGRQLLGEGLAVRVGHAAGSVARVDAIHDRLDVGDGNAIDALGFDLLVLPPGHALYGVLHGLLVAGATADDRRVVGIPQSRPDRAR